MLRLARSHHLEMIGHAYDGLPLEACGLLVGRPGTGEVEAFVPCRNADASARTYSIGPECWEKADTASAEGSEVIGVMHSHTHTEAYPSPTDVERAANPLLSGWHYVIVSLRHAEPVLRSYLIADGAVVEESVLVERR